MYIGHTDCMHVCYSAGADEHVAVDFSDTGTHAADTVQWQTHIRCQKNAESHYSALDHRHASASKERRTTSDGRKRRPTALVGRREASQEIRVSAMHLHVS